MKSLNQYSTKVRQNLNLAEAPIISYLGLYLLLARYGNDLLSTQDREGLEQALGMDLAEAQALTQNLLKEQHSVGSAVVDAWANQAPDHMSTPMKPLPDQKALDTWASQNTHGMIKQFPASPGPDDVLLASAVALKMSWRKEFRKVGKMLHGYNEHAKVLTVMDTAAAGKVVVFVPQSDAPMSVMSVMAEDNVLPEQVWAAVAEVQSRWQELFTLPQPLENGHGWTVDETFTHGSEDEVTQVFVPAWKEEGKYSFTQADGVQLFKGNYESVDCLQTAVGDYCATGFSAAAVTAMLLRAANFSFPPQRRVPEITYKFDRPHALTAMAHGGMWEQVRLFDAWVKP